MPERSKDSANSSENIRFEVRDPNNSKGCQIWFGLFLALALLGCGGLVARVWELI